MARNYKNQTKIGAWRDPIAGEYFSSATGSAEDRKYTDVVEPEPISARGQQTKTSHYRPPAKKMDPDTESFELQNRMKNLLWTVSGDYTLDVNLDLKSFKKSKYISIYDAVKQGAFARYFNMEELSMYIVKKIYMEADQAPLM